MEIRFDQKKLSVVPIDLVVPNTWNPKEKNTAEFQKVKKSIELHGQRQPVVVRSNSQKARFEIIDGEQKWTACKQLGFKDVLIYDEGELSDKEAKELTIAYQQQVPFSDIKIAELVNSLITDFGQDIKIPYADVEVKSFENLATYDWSKPPEEWVGMPNFQKGQEYFKVNVTCETEEDRQAFLDKIGATLINKTVGNVQCIWYPQKEKDDVKSIEFE